MSWFGRFSEVVLTFEMKRCQSDHTIFFNKSNYEILLVVYVDDIVITGSDNK